MPLNANILSLLRQQNPANSQTMAKGVDPNLEMILQAMGMMPRQLDMQGRPILSGVKNPSTMDQHYARQANPEAMKDRYSSPTFAMGAIDPNRMAPATKLPGQGPIVAHQPVTGLPGQVGPAYSTQMTPINVFPSPTEGDAMDTVRKQYRETMFPPQTQAPNPSAVPQWQGPPAPQMPQWQGPPVPSVQEEAQNISRQAMAQWDAGQRTSSPEWQGPYQSNVNPFVPKSPVAVGTNFMPMFPPNVGGMSSTTQTPFVPGQMTQTDATPSVANPMAKMLANRGQEFLARFPIMQNFAPTIPQATNPSAADTWKLLRQKGANLQRAFPIVNKFVR